MKTILYIDTFSQFGHTNLNKVFIQQFKNIGFTVDVIMREGYAKDLKIPPSEIKVLIPDRYFNMYRGKIGERITQWMMLRFIKRNAKLKQYDCVFFSFFDEISYTLARINGNLFFLNHSNVSGLDNFVKRFFLKKIEKKGRIVVFHETIKSQFEKFNITNVLVEPLGLSRPYLIDKIVQNKILASIDDRLISTKFNLKIFIPSASKYQDTFLLDAISNKDFLNFLVDKQILLIIKNEPIGFEHPNLCVLGNFLSDNEYQSVFLMSDFLLIHYPESFKFKVSASLFECFSNNKPCILSDIESFRVFEKHFLYAPFYTGIKKLMEVIDKAIFNKKAILSDPYIDLHLLNPRMNTILQSIERND